MPDTPSPQELIRRRIKANLEWPEAHSKQSFTRPAARDRAEEAVHLQTLIKRWIQQSPPIGWDIQDKGFGVKSLIKRWIQNSPWFCWCFLKAAEFIMLPMRSMGVWLTIRAAQAKRIAISLERLREKRRF